MNPTANNIKHRLSLRDPLQESLDIEAALTRLLTMEKCPEDETLANEFLARELEKVNNLHPTCTDFERDFPTSNGVCAVHPVYKIPDDGSVGLGVFFVKLTEKSFHGFRLFVLQR